MTVTCKYEDNTLKSCVNVTDGTTAQFHCADFYEDQIVQKQVRFCSNGKWVGGLPKCVPVCGKSSKGENYKLIVGGNYTTRGQYPWQVALYSAKNKELLCGGTLLNQRVILTAAHCITTVTGKLEYKENYIVAVGKYFRQYDHRDDATTAQFSSIYQMYVPRQYRANIQNYFGDIGIIVTKKVFDLSVNVLPVCVEWETKRHQALTDPTKIKHAYISGWGYTVVDRDPSHVLKHLRVPLVSDEDCNRNIPEDDAEYITDDKFCAGFLNSNTSVCNGDSGGGLVCRYRKRYYIIGIVSITPRGDIEEEGCNSQQYTLYTKFSYYIENFILEKEARFRPQEKCGDDSNCEDDVPETTPSPPPETTEVAIKASTSQCTLPNHPEAGKWTILFRSFGTRLPGMSVPSETVLKVECNNNSKLDGQEIVVCNTNKWTSDLGRCLKFCPPRFSTSTMQVTCTYDNKIIENCTQVVTGTIAKFQCARFYEDLQLTARPFHICTNGTWDQALPQCEPMCGQRSSTTSVVNGKSVSIVKYPWHVGIHYKTWSNRLICSGSLLSQRIVLTAAICLTEFQGILRPKENFVVVVGQTYKKFNDNRERHVQFSDVEAMFISDYFNASFYGDIGILVTKKTFVLTLHVLPACLDVGQSYKNSENEFGYLSSWDIEDLNSSDVVIENKVALVPLSTCRGKLADEISITADKLCGRTLENGTHCTFESVYEGSGLLRKRGGKYYVVGVATFSARIRNLNFRSACDSEQITVYTDVSKYISSFILKYIAKYKT